jgi:hypothetical protein
MKSLRALLSAVGAVLFLAIPVVTLKAEGVRTVVASVIQVSADRPEGESVSLGYAESVSIGLSVSPFIQGIEIEIRIPKPMQSAQGAFAWTLYRALSPAPSVDRVAYDGERILMQPLPPRAGLVLQLPVSSTHSLRSGPYATVLPVVLETAADFPLLFKFASLSKGLSTEQEKARYQVKIRPVFIEEGALRLTLVHPDGAAGSAAPSVYVDEKKIESYQELVFLKKGTHTLHVTAEGLRDETRTFAVEPGKTSTLEIQLQGTKPVIIFEAPANAVIRLDDEPVDHASASRLVVEPGEHAVVCRIGDYTITRKFSAVRGKTYRIVLSVGVEIQETP